MNFNQFLSAEREGFEPPEPLSSTVFKTAAIDHSAISPSVYATHFRFESGAKFQASMRHTFVLKAVQSYECFLILQTFLHVF